MDINQLKRLLATNIAPHLDDPDTKHAAVLVVIYGSEPKIIMTKKSQTMREHAGEISFPGGKLAENDFDLMATALRETSEEIGLNLTPNQVTGQLESVRTRNSGFTIIPFVAVLQQIPTLYPNSEVEEILKIPLVPLLKSLKVDDDPEHRALFEAYVAKFEDIVIWGATARILKQIKDIFSKNNLF